MTADATTPDPPVPVGRSWTTGRLAEVDHVGERIVRIRLEVDERTDHVPGQHYVVRLRAEDGYTAQRSYSIASDPAEPLVELLVERLPGGEVSGFLHDEARAGDEVELRGPIGRWFVWTAGQRALCVVGGTGVVPAVSMLRYARRVGRADLLTVVAVGRTWDELPYADELAASGALVALTREDRGGRYGAPPSPREVAPLADGVERAYVCGSAGFASFATRLLGEVGVRSDVVRVEQFGATG